MRPLGDEVVALLTQTLPLSRTGPNRVADRSLTHALGPRPMM